ncbi:MAG: VacJ family lipoprotein, partial [Candidatus Omnitrophica bacterium]|nr:VacJ family lipoprotein [Candidatus Omnitrophota bacterium]
MRLFSHFRFPCLPIQHLGVFIAMVAGALALFTPQPSSSQCCHQPNATCVCDQCGNCSPVLCEPDPLKPLNKAMFFVNDTLHGVVIGPISQAYSCVVPPVVRTSVGNFYHNLKMPIRVGNLFIQGRFCEGQKEMERFAINSTEGVLGLGDPARECYCIEGTDASLDQTLAMACIPEGPYLVLPLVGPSTLRGAVGGTFDSLADPQIYVPELAPLGVINQFSLGTGPGGMDEYSQLRRTPCPYETQRYNHLTQRRREIWCDDAGAGYSDSMAEGMSGDSSTGYATPPLPT